MPVNVTPLSSEELITASVFMDAIDVDTCTDLGRILVDSCDIVRVFLKEYTTREWMHADHVRIYRNQPGEHTTFTDCENIPGYHVIVSPHFQYPPDFVMKLVQRIERHKRKAIIGLGGGWHLVPSGFRSIPIEEGVNRDLPVHELDCSVLAYHASVAHFTRDIFSINCNLDETLSVWAQKYQIPLIIAQHPCRWITRYLIQRNSITYRNTNNTYKGTWQLFAVRQNAI